MTLQFPIPQFIGEAVRYQGQSWVWDGVGWAIDTTADRIDLATVPAYLGQFVYRMPSVPPLPTFVSLSDPDIFGATFILSTVAPFEGIKVYKNGELLVMDGGAGGPGQYVVNRAANRIEFLPPGLVAQDVITIGVLTPSDRLAPGRVDVQPIKDLDTDWVTNPGAPTTGMVDGVRRTFDLLVDVPGVGQQFAVISRNSDLAVIVGGARQRPGVDYIVVGAELTMTVAPVAGVPFWALWYRPAGGGTGGGVAPPQPPLDGQQSFYGWRPGTGAAWQDARGVTITVANAAARTGLRPDIDIANGSLVLQADTQDLWRWTGAAWVRYLDSGTFTARLGGRMQSLRSTTALQRPAAASLLPGELWVNQADRVFGFGDAAGDPIEFLARVVASAGVADAGKLPALNPQGVLDQSVFLAGMRPYGTIDIGSIAITDWNNAHLNGTTVVRAPAGTPNRPPGPDLPYAGNYIAMGNADTGVLTALSPEGNTVYVRPRAAGVWGAWIQVNSPGLDISSAMLRANNLNDVQSKPAGRTNLEVLFNPRTVYAGDLDVLDETGLYPLGIGVTNGWVNDGTGAGGEATVGDAVLHIETGGSLAYQLGFNVIPTGPAAKPLRMRFMTGPTTWTPWASMSTSDEVAAQITAAINAAVAALPPGTAAIGPTAPATPVAGQFWYNTTVQGLFVYRTDTDPARWEQSWPDPPPGTFIGDNPPPSPEEGQLWFKTLDPVGLYIWYNDGDSSQWVQAGGGGGGGGSVSGGSALGSIAYFASPNAPAGWLVCDGAAVTSANKALRDYLLAAGSPYGVDGLNPRVPDLRGEFIRGWDDGRGVDPGRAFGSAQGDANKAHTHSFTRFFSVQRVTISGSATNGHIGTDADPPRAIDTSSQGANEARPRNVALLPCINASGSAGIVNPPVDIVQGASGWQVVGDVLICWGGGSSGAGSGLNVVYPRAFKSIPQTICAADQNDPGAVLDLIAQPSNRTETGCRIITQAGRAFASGIGIRWIAIGEARDEDKMPKAVPGGDAGTPTPGVSPVKAWGTFNGGTNAVLAAENLTMARTATGEFTFTFDTPLPDTNYAVTVGLGSAGGGFGSHVIGNKTVNGFTMVVNRIDVSTVRANPALIEIAVIGQGSAGNGSPFATERQAVDGLRTDVVMSPALVQARQGRQQLILTGQGLAPFNQIPDEATEIDLIINGLGALANTAVRLDFEGAPNARAFSTRMGAPNGVLPTVVGDDNNAYYILDFHTAVIGLAGMLRLVREGPGQAWGVSGSLRRSTAFLITYGGVFGMNGDLSARLRLSCTAAMTSGAATVRWRI